MHWIQQIRAILDDGNSKPILIVGTHVDKLPKHVDPEQKMHEMIKELQLSTHELKGSFAISLRHGSGMHPKLYFFII